MGELTIGVDAVYADTFSVVRTNDPLFTNTRNEINSSTSVVINGTTYKLVLRHYDYNGTHMFFWIVKPGYEATYTSYYTGPYDFGGGVDAWDMDPVAYVDPTTVIESGQQLTISYTQGATVVSTLNSLTIEENAVSLNNALSSYDTVTLNTYVSALNISYVLSNINATIDISGNSNLIPGTNVITVDVSGSAVTRYTINVTLPKPSYNVDSFLNDFVVNNFIDFTITKNGRTHIFHNNAVTDISGVVSATLTANNVTYGSITNLPNFITSILFGVHIAEDENDHTSFIIYLISNGSVFNSIDTASNISLDFPGVISNSIGIYYRSDFDNNYRFLFNSNRNNDLYDFDLSGGNVSGEFRNGLLDNNNQSSDTSLSVFTINGNSVADGDTINLANGTTSVTVIATATNIAASVDISGSTGLLPGSQNCEVTVTAEDGAIQTYSVILRVASLAISNNTFDTDPASIANDTPFNIETNSQVFEMKKTAVTTDVSGNKVVNSTVDGKTFSVGDLPAEVSDVIIGHNSSTDPEQFVTKIVVLDASGNKISSFATPLTFTIYFPGAITQTIPIYTQQSLDDAPSYETTGTSIGNNLYTFTLDHLTFIRPGYDAKAVFPPFWNVTFNHLIPRSYSVCITKNTLGDNILAYTTDYPDRIIVHKLNADGTYNQLYELVISNKFFTSLVDFVINGNFYYFFVLNRNVFLGRSYFSPVVYKVNRTTNAVVWTNTYENMNFNTDSGFFRNKAYAAKMEISSSGDIYIATVSDLGISGERLPAPGVILYKIDDSTGSTVWKKESSLNINNAKLKMNVDFKFDSSGNIYMVYNDNQLIPNRVNQFQNYEINMAKFTSDGTFVWKKSFKTDLGNDGNVLKEFLRLGIDNANNFYISYFNADGAGRIPAFQVFKVNESGQFAWKVHPGNFDISKINNVRYPTGAITDANGNTYVNYGFERFETGSAINAARGYNCTGVTKINSGGTIVWDIDNPMSRINRYENMQSYFIVDQNAIYTSGICKNDNNSPGWGHRNFYVFKIEQSETLPTAPGQPTSLNATPNLATTSIALSWTAPASFGTVDGTNSASLKNYRVYMNGTLILNTNITTTSYTVTGLTPGVAYTFSVSAVNNLNLEGAKSSTTTSTIVTVPSAPTITSADGANGVATIVWTKPENGGATITGYTVTIGATEVNVNGENTLTTNVSGLTMQVVHTVTVKANNSQGSSAPSEEMKFYLFTFNKDSTILNNVKNSYNQYELKIVDSSLNTFKLSNNDELSVIQLRASAKATQAILNLTNNQIVNLRRNLNGSLRSKIGTSNILISSTNISKFLETFNNYVADLNTAPSIVYVPQQIVRDSDGPCVELDVENMSQYKAVEIPIDCKLILKSGATTVELKFKGTYYEPWAGGTAINIGDTITVGSTRVKLFAVGSGIFGPSNDDEGDGGGGNGDPYVTTVHKKHYKLPSADIPIRFYQGMVGKKLLTVNANLRTVESNDLIGYNLHSFMELKNNIPRKTQQVVLNKLFNNQLLCFFEKVHISYGDSCVVLDVWDGKFVVNAHSGDEIKSIVGTSTVPNKYTEEYKNYSNNTIVLLCGSAKVFVSVYKSKMVRNGIFVEAPNMKLGNGVIVNTLSQSDMTLTSLVSKDPVPNRDSVVKHHKETFIDAGGMRVRTISHV
jgi:hypothetical protein